MLDAEIRMSVDKYISAVTDIKDSINEIHGGSFIVNHKRTLLFSVIDLLSKGAYGDKYGNNRTSMFENFIIDFCEWEEANRVSLQQLLHLLDKTEDQRFVELKEFAKSKLNEFHSDQPVPFNLDPTIEQLEELMPKGESKILGIEITRLRHVSLLWKLRNSLVHEARAKGALQLFDFVTKPHYIHYGNIERDEENKLIVTTETWEMYYPLIFFNKLIETSFTNLITYFLDNRVNPFDNYDFSPLWIEIKEERYR